MQTEPDQNARLAATRQAARRDRVESLRPPPRDGRGEAAAPGRVSHGLTPGSSGAFGKGKTTGSGLAEWGSGLAGWGAGLAV